MSYVEKLESGFGTDSGLGIVIKTPDDSPGGSFDEETDDDVSHGQGDKQRYLRQFCNFPLLSPQDEQELGWIVQSNLYAILKICLMAQAFGDAELQFSTFAFARHLANKSSVFAVEDLLLSVNRALKKRTLTKEIELLLCQKMSAVHEAKNRIVEGNLRLPIFMVRREFVCPDSLWMNFVQAGNIGLIRAALRFEPWREVKFSTFAMHWIRQAIREVLTETHVIRWPQYFQAAYNRCSIIYCSLTKELNREPSMEEFAENLERAGLLPIYFREVDIAHVVTSLDLPVGGEENNFLSDFIADERIDILENIFYRQMQEKAHQVVERLDPSKRDVMKQRLFEGKTLEEVGQKRKISRERVRQIQRKALKVLRRFPSADKLKPFWEDLD